VEILDIAVPLSRAPRFAGHSRFEYSVAAHSIHVSLLVPEHLRLQALFHDASEAYLADIPSPFKALMPDYKVIEEGIMQAIAKRFKFDFPIDPIVKQADAAALWIERRTLFISPAGEDEAVIPYVKPPCECPEWDTHTWSLKRREEVAAEFFNYISAYRDDEYHRHH
jgi:hypothetical protein